MTIRSTFALDRKTANGLARLARRWDVSKSEALRRAVAHAEAQPADDDGKMTPREALARLRQQPPLTKTQADAWVRENRATRRAGDDHFKQRKSRRGAERDSA